MQTTDDGHWVKAGLAAIASVAAAAGAWWKLRHGLTRERIRDADAITHLEHRLEDFMESTATAFSELRIDLERVKRTAQRSDSREDEHFHILAEQLNRMEEAFDSVKRVLSGLRAQHHAERSPSIDSE